MPPKKKAKTAIQFDSADDERTGLRIYCEKQGDEALNLLCALNNAFQGFIFSFGFLGMFPVGYADRYSVTTSFEYGFDFSIFPFMVAYYHDEIGVGRWFDVFTDGLQNVDDITRGYIPLNDEQDDKTAPTSKEQVTLPYDLLLLRVGITICDNDEQDHYFVVRKFRHEAQEVWICLDSLLDTRPFVVASIGTFLFGEDGETRTCTNHLMADRDVSHIGDTIIVYGIRAAFSEKIFDYERRSFIELRRGREDRDARCFGIFHVDDLESR
jgi:hypothetical protein